MARRAIAYVRLALAREDLGESPPNPGPSRERSHGVLHMLFLSREPLGEEPVASPAPRRSVLRWLLAAEPLPLDPEPPRPPARRGRLAQIFGPERLDGPP